MRKHFLLFFLMLLLPLGAWAQDYVEVTISPFDASATWCNGKPAVTRAWFQSPGATNPNVKDVIATLLEVQDLEEGYNVGEHTYKLKLKNGANNTVYQYEHGIRTTTSNELGDLEKVYTIFTSSATAVLNITKYETPAAIILNDLAYVTTALTYTGGVQNLLTIGEGTAPTATTLGGSLPVTVVYALQADADTWTADYASLTGTDAGTYHVWYKVADTDNYQGTVPAELAGDGKEIAKGLVDFTNIAASAATLPYNGTNQQLLTKADNEEPLVNFGAANLVYRINSDNDADWASLSDLTAITGKNADEYTIELKVPATANYDNGAGADATTTINVTINRIEIDEENATVALAEPEQTFTYKGEAWEPELTVSYEGNALTTDNHDIAIAYANNTDAGDATATVTFNNYYKDDVNVAYTKDLIFNIAKKSLADEGVTASVISTQLNQTYKGSAFTGSTFAYANLNVYVGDTKLTSASYERSYQNNINVGSMDDPDETKRPAVIITGKGNYTGVTKAYFNIVPRSIDDANIAIDDAIETAQTYTSSQITPSTEGMITYSTPDPDYTLLENTDYTVAYGENISGTGTITITGTGNFTGEVVKEFAIGNATAYIVPLAKSKLYGAVEPTLTWKVVDAEGTELGNNVLNGEVTLAREEGVDVGTYKIYVVNYEADAEDHYTVANLMNDPNSDDAKNKVAPFTIFANTENTLVLKFKEGVTNTKVYDGTTAVTFTADDFEDVDGLLNEDTWETIGAGATITAELSGSDAGEVTATATINGLANYPYIQVQNSPLAFTITPRPITITANDQVIDQGESILQGEYVVSDDVTAYGDTNDDLNIVLTATKTAVGEWEDAITVAATNSNYSFSYVEGDLVINGAAEIALDDSEANNYDIIKAYDGKENQSVAVNISKREQTIGSKTFKWNGKQYNMMVLPFDVSAKEISEQLGYAVVYRANKDKATETDIYFSLAWDVPANEPFAVKTYADAPDVKVLKFEDKTIVAPETAYPSVDAGNGFKLVGAYETFEINQTSASKFRFFGDGKHNGIKAGSTATWNVIPFDGYIDLTGNATAPELVTITFEGEDGNGSATAIRSIENSNAKVAGEGWYNLNGVKLEGAPAEKGVYIQNGKKVIIK